MLDFTMLAQYLLYNYEILSYMDHALYKPDKTKIAFENHCLIDAKLFQPTFNYPKLHAMIQIHLRLQKPINYDTTHSEIAQKYFLKVFYGRTHKNKYKSQILKHNICHTNVIAM